LIKGLEEEKRGGASVYDAIRYNTGNKKINLRGIAAFYLP